MTHRSSRRAALRPGRLPLAAIAASALLLAACSSSGPRSVGTGARADPGMSTQAARRGGYYLDDGPGSGPMPDLDTIPDATPRAEPLHPRANRPYVVFDRQYTPMTALGPYRERGIGSWYGRRYHGQRTSSGEVYDMYAMTAAHPTLPIPSYVRVTSASTGRSVVVRVNDRGPFLHGRLIDLSYTAAAKLGYAGGGSAEVDVELITRFDAPATGAVAPTSMPTLSNTPASALTVTAVAASTAVATAPSVVTGPAARPERLEIETLVAPSNPPVAALSPAASAPAALSAPTAPAAPSPAIAASMRGNAAPTAAIRAESAISATSARSAAASSGSHFLQLAAFATRENAESSRTRLARDLDWLADRLLVRQEDGMFKVHAGPYRQRDEALSEAERIRQATAFKPFPVAR